MWNLTENFIVNIPCLGIKSIDALSNLLTLNGVHQYYISSRNLFLCFKAVINNNELEKS